MGVVRGKGDKVFLLDLEKGEKICLVGIFV